MCLCGRVSWRTYPYCVECVSVRVCVADRACVHVPPGPPERLYAHTVVTWRREGLGTSGVVVDDVGAPTEML